MQDKIKELINLATREICVIDQPRVLQDFKVKILGKNGELTALLRGLKDVKAEDRPQVGKFVNEARETIEALFAKKENEFAKKELDRQLSEEYVDVTIDKKVFSRGTLHPLTLVTNELIEIFTNLGFKVLEGPQIETDYYNFQALNVPKNHPARDAQDTFYITENLVLRTHTSPNQIRTMEKTQPPIKMVCPGAVFRADDDATHSPVFYQIEGLVVDKNVTMCDLKGTLEKVAKSLFSEKTKMRLRPSYFPFTEPSVEVDFTCSDCGGKGCRLCKGTGWLEILGAGMVNPVVLENCGIDANVYSGFAFGIGIDRLAMIKYGIPSIGLLYENDVRFNKQFK